MKPFESELQDLSVLYRGLHEKLADSEESDRSKGTTALIDTVLQNRELLSRIVQMDSRIGQLAIEWERIREGLDPVSRDSIRQLAESLRREASDLKEIVDRRAHQIECSRAHLEHKLGEIRRGEKFLESVKPIRINYPKFIDSLG